MYYQKCYDVAVPIVEHFFTDVTKHDKAALNGFTGRFIYGLRKCGTNLLKMDGTYTRRERQWAEAFCFSNDQTHFYLGQGGKLKEVTRERARREWDTFKRSKGART